MRYSENHKQETRERVLKLAAAALREEGPDRLGVAEVMKAAGLTHGGFYAHFKSKDEFLAAALSEVFAQSAENAKRYTEKGSAREALSGYIDFYVSQGHRDHPGTGCPIPALNSDLPRQSKLFRRVFDIGVKRLVDQVARWVAEIGLENPEQIAASVVSAMAGAIAVSRAVSDRKLSDELISSANAGIKARLGL